jgi:hypothetical protein
MHSIHSNVGEHIDPSVITIAVEGDKHLRLVHASINAAQYCEGGAVKGERE